MVDRFPPLPDLFHMELIEPVDVERVRPPHGVEPAMFALMLATFTIGTGEFAMMGLLPELSHSLGISISRASSVISAYALGVVVGAPLIAVAGAKLPRRTLLLAMLVLFLVGNTGTILMPNLLDIEVMRFITGLPHGAFFGVSALVGASMVERARRGRTVGRVLSGIMFSTVVGSPSPLTPPITSDGAPLTLQFRSSGCCVFWRSGTSPRVTNLIRMPMPWPNSEPSNALRFC